VFDSYHTHKHADVTAWLARRPRIARRPSSRQHCPGDNESSSPSLFLVDERTGPVATDLNRDPLLSLAGHDGAFTALEVVPYPPGSVTQVVNLADLGDPVERLDALEASREIAPVGYVDVHHPFRALPTAPG